MAVGEETPPTHAALPDGGLTPHFVIDAQLPTAAEKAALAGSPTAPGPANPYLTAAHAADPSAHHAPLSTSDTPSVALTLVGQALSAAVRLRPGGHLLTHAEGLAVDVASLHLPAVYNCTANLNLTTALQNVAGCATGSFTPTRDETALVAILFSLNQAGGSAPCNANDSVEVQLYDAAAARVLTSATTAATGNAGTNQRVKVHLMGLSAGVGYNLLLRARNTSGNRGQITTATQLFLWRLAA